MVIKKTVNWIILIIVVLILIIVTLTLRQNQELEGIDDLVSLNIESVKSLEIVFTSTGDSAIIDEESMKKIIIEYLKTLSIESFITDKEEVYGGFGIDINYKNEETERLKISGNDHEAF